MAINMAAFRRLQKKNAQANQKQRQKNVQQTRKEEKKERQKAVKTNRRIQRQVGSSKAGRALMGAVYGFNTNMVPLSYSAKASKLGFNKYSPSAAAVERGDLTKQTADFNRYVENSKAYKMGHLAGGVGATALQFMMGKPIIKPLGGKIASTGAAKAAQEGIKKQLLNRATKQGVTKKVLERILQKKGSQITAHGITRAAGTLSKNIVKNASEDIAGDVTVGLYQDLASAKANGVDIKDPKQLAPYLVQQGAINTAVGTVTNGAGTAIGMMGKNKKFWKTVERLGSDGKVHKIKKYVPSAPTKDVVSKSGIGDKAREIISPKFVKAGKKQASDLADSQLKRSTLSRAVHNQQFVDDIRKNGIDGLSLDEYAAKNKMSRKEAVETAYRKFEKENPIATSNLDRLRDVTPTKTNAAKNLSVKMGDTKVGSRAVSKRVRGAFDPTNPGETIFRNQSGRKVMHRVTDADYRKAADFDANGVESIVDARKARLQQATAEQTKQDQLRQILRDKRAAKEAGINPATADISGYEQAIKNGEPINQSAGAVDPTMGGKRTGTMAGESEAASTVSHQAGNTKAEAAQLDEYLSETNTGKKFTETNKEAVDNARTRIDEDGIEKSRAYIRRKYDNGEMFTNEDNAEIVIDMERYRAIERVAKANGDTATEEAARAARDELASIEVAELSETGKMLQSAKLFHSMTPEGRVNSVAMMVRKIEKKRGVHDIQVDDDLLDQLKNATNDNEIQEVKDKIARQIWDQVPATWTEKAAAWRYMAMLFNPRTHLRNIAGNGIFAPVKGIKNMIGAGIETLAGSSEKSKAFLNPFSSTDKQLLDFANSQWDDVSNLFLSGGKKYDLGLMRAEGSKVFNTKFLQKLYDFNSNALNKEDEWFARIAYSRSYAQYLKANGIDPATASQEALEKAQKYAWDEALNSTYREANALADWINKQRRGAQMSARDVLQSENVANAAIQKGWGTLADALVPFSKTPANIMKNGVYYSPLGIIRGIAKIANASTPEKQIKAIDALAQGLTGSGIVALGWFAAENGMVTGSIPSGYKTDEEQTGKYDKDRGIQEYAIGDHTIKKIDLFNLISKMTGKEVDKNKQTMSATVDWAVPAAMPFFMGVEAYNAIKESLDPTATAEDKLKTFGRVLTNLPKLADPVLNLSMLSSIENAFDTYTESDSGTSAAVKFLENSAQSRLGQYVPTALGQITNSFVDESKRDTTPKMSGNVGDWERWIRQQENKIPGLSQRNPYKSDAFGQRQDTKENNRDKLLAYAKNAISPAVIRSVRNSDADKAIQDLVDEGVAPSKIYPQKQTESDVDKVFEDKKFDLSRQDVATYNENHGQYAIDQINKLVKTKQYQNASTKERTALIQQTYRDATKYANEQLAKSKGMSDREIMLANLEEYWVKVNQKEQYLEKEKKLKNVGIKQETSMKIWDRVGTANQLMDKNDVNSSRGPGITLKTLAAMEAKGGELTAEQAKAATNAFEKTNEKAINLYNAGYTTKQCAKFILTDAERDKIPYYNRKGEVSGIDKIKLAEYIDKKKISRREKWARYEINRDADWTNPFSY